MEITVLKCDRCKKEVKGLIEYSFINRNIQEEDGNEKPLDGLTSLMIFGKQIEYPTVQGGLCLDCIEEISRWLGHPENMLTVGKDGG